MGTFTLEIKVSLSEETLDVLRQFAPDLPDETCSCPACPDLKNTVEGLVVNFLEKLKKHAEKPVDGPKPEKVPEPVQETKAPQAAPEEPAPEPEAPVEEENREITDAELRPAVKAALDRGGRNAVIAVFDEFGIPNSSACPQERRSELLGRLKDIK